jgi:hypothetical protein
VKKNCAFLQFIGNLIVIENLAVFFGTSGFVLKFCVDWWENLGNRSCIERAMVVLFFGGALHLFFVIREKNCGFLRVFREFNCDFSEFGGVFGTVGFVLKFCGDWCKNHCF